MSSSPTTDPPISKSAAKKRAKKATKETSDPIDSLAVESLTVKETTGGRRPLPLPTGQYPFSFPFNLAKQNGGESISQSINITHEDLLDTANELWKRMAESTYGDDDPYWSSLPPHVRQFIREAIPFNGSSNNTNDPHATQKDLYAMAQRIVHAASQGMGLGANGRVYPGIGEELGFHRHPDKEEEYEDEDEFEDEPEFNQPNGTTASKKKKKNKKKKAATIEPPPTSLPPPAVKQPPRPPQLNPPPPPAPAPAPAPAQPLPSSRAAGKQPMTTNQPARSARAQGKAPVTHQHTHTHPQRTTSTTQKPKAQANAPPAKIWTTSSAEERESITRFWLGLTDAERRDLLQIEKDAVLRRMKEQHRNSCSCAVCGRKKVNIEMELDHLYEQYYRDLQAYTIQQKLAAHNGKYEPPSGAGPFPGSVELDSSGQLLKLDHLAPAPTPQLDPVEEDYDDEEEEYDDDEELEDEEGSEEEEYRKPKSLPRADGSEDFFGFGSNLTTIKDDLLKNDGSKFLDMMEQLAVRRVSRDEINAQDVQEEDDGISEAQRVEEGKRMFAIFAARMFEQRVLQAYRERVAKEREEQLLRELEMEEDTKKAKEEKKAKEAQKKKDKKRLQKLKQEEERAAREAQIAEEQRQAKLKAEEAEKERIKKQEEERQRREAAKRAAQEEATRREAERRKRQEEEKAREEEAARKKREREDKIKKEREAREREAKEKERKDKEEKERKSKEEKERKDKEEKERAAEKAERAEKAAAKAAAEKAAADKVAADKAAVDKSAMEKEKKVKAEKERLERERAAAEKAEKEKAEAEAAAAAAAAVKLSPIAPPQAIPMRSKSISTPQATTPPLSTNPSPPNIRSASGSRPFAFGTVPAFRAPPPPTAVPNYSSAPGYRPPFAQPFPNGQTSSSALSPNARFGTQPLSSIESPPYERSIGMGFPPVKARVPSFDEPFTATSAPIQRLSSASIEAGISGSSALHDDFRRLDPSPIGRAPEPIGPVGGSALGLRRPFDNPPTSSKPTGGEQIFGSAALGDDEVVPSRPKTNGWESIAPMPIPSAAPGAGRWNSPASLPGSSIWNSATAAAPGAPVDSGSWLGGPASSTNGAAPIGFGAPSLAPGHIGHGGFGGHTSFNGPGRQGSASFASAFGGVGGTSSVAIGSGAIGSGAIGSGAIGSGAIGSGAIGSGAIGSGPIGSGAIGSGAIGSGAIGSGAIGSGLLSGAGVIGSVGNIGPGGPGAIGAVSQGQGFPYGPGLHQSHSHQQQPSSLFSPTQHGSNL